jgi:hypothetical protein
MTPPCDIAVGSQFSAALRGDYGLNPRLQSVFHHAVRNTVVHMRVAFVVRVAARNRFGQQANEGHVLVE